MGKSRTLSPFRRPVGPTAVTVTIARHATWLLGDADNGLQPGHFITRLWRLMECADQTNLELLRAGWPGYVEAFEAQGRTHWGVEWLRDKARYGDEKIEIDLGQLADDEPRIGGVL